MNNFNILKKLGELCLKARTPLSCPYKPSDEENTAIREDNTTKYYAVTYKPRKGWYFIIPASDGPEVFLETDMLVGPYITRIKAQEDADKCRSKSAIMR